MTALFQSQVKFNQYISTKVVTVGGSTYTAWDTLNVLTLGSILSASGNSGAFNQNIGKWDVRNVTAFGSSFMGGKTPSDFSAENLDAIYNGWSAQNVQRNITIGFGTIKYSAAGAAGRAKLVNDYGWTITDGGQTT
jgi:hypothetical protein